MWTFRRISLARTDAIARIGNGHAVDPATQFRTRDRNSVSPETRIRRDVRPTNHVYHDRNHHRDRDRTESNTDGILATDEPLPAASPRTEITDFPGQACCRRTDPAWNIRVTIADLLLVGGDAGNTLQPVFLEYDRTVVAHSRRRFRVLSRGVSDRHSSSKLAWLPHMATACGRRDGIGAEVLSYLDSDGLRQFSRIDCLPRRFDFEYRASPRISVIGNSLRSLSGPFILSPQESFPCLARRTRHY